MSMTRVQHQGESDFALALQRAAFASSATPSENAERVVSLVATEVCDAMLKEEIDNAIWEIVAESLMSTSEVSRSRTGYRSSLFFSSSLSSAKIREKQIDQHPRLRLQYLSASTVEEIETASEANDETFSDEGGDEGTVMNESEIFGIDDSKEEKRKKRRQKPLALVERYEPVKDLSETERQLFVGDDGIRRQLPPHYARIFQAEEREEEAAARSDDFEEDFDEEGDDDLTTEATPRTSSFALSSDEDKELEEPIFIDRRRIADELKSLGYILPKRRIRRGSFAETIDDTHIEKVLKGKENLLPAATTTAAPPSESRGEIDQTTTKYRVIDAYDDDTNSEADSVVLDFGEDDNEYSVLRFVDPSLVVEEHRRQPRPACFRAITTESGKIVATSLEKALSLLGQTQDAALGVALLRQCAGLEYGVADEIEKWLETADDTSSHNASSSSSCWFAVLATALLRFRLGLKAPLTDRVQFDHEGRPRRRLPRQNPDENDDAFATAFSSLETEEAEKKQLDPQETNVLDDDDSEDDEEPPDEKHTLEAARSSASLLLADEYLLRARLDTPLWSEDQAIRLVQSLKVRYDASAAIALKLSWPRLLAAVLRLAVREPSVSASVAALDALARTSDPASLQHRSLALRKVLAPRSLAEDDFSPGSQQRAPLCVALLRLGALDRLAAADALEPFHHLLRNVLDLRRKGGPADIGSLPVAVPVLMENPPILSTSASTGTLATAATSMSSSSNNNKSPTRNKAKDDLISGQQQQRRRITTTGNALTTPALLWDDAFATWLNNTKKRSSSSSAAASTTR